MANRDAAVAVCNTQEEAAERAYHPERKVVMSPKETASAGQR